MISDHNCRLCSLWEGAKTVCVDGRGSLPADILFIGEAPGPEEDARGQAFLGRAGRLLDNTIKPMLLETNLTYRVSNVARCFPGRDANNSFIKPTAKQIKACSSYLLAEIRACKPKVIVALGGTASKVIVGDGRIAKVRGLRLSWIDPDTGVAIPAIAVYHPSFIARDDSGSQTKLVEWGADLKQAVMWADGQDIVNKASYRLIETFDEAVTYLRYLIDGHKSGAWDAVSFDVETDADKGHDPMLKCWGPGKILTAQFAVKPGEAVMLALHHPQSPLSPLEIESLEKGLLPEFIREVPIYGHAVDYDCHWVREKWGVWPKVAFDTIHAHRLVTSGLEPASLYTLATRHCGMQGYEAKKREADQSIPNHTENYFRLFPLREILLDYGCGDADAVCRIRPIYEKLLTDNNLWPAMRLVMNAFDMVADLAREGFPLDLGLLKTMEDTFLEKEIAGPREQFESSLYYELHTNRTGQPLKISSNVQLADFLYTTLKCAVEITTPKGEPSCAKLALVGIHDRYIQYRPIIEAIQAIKKVEYLYRNSIVKLRKKEHVFPDGRVHPEYDLAGTDTGRLSARNPPIHNVPRGSVVRRIYRSRSEKGLILQLDYAQAELRVFAMLSGDKEFCAVFERGEDPHRFVASEVFRIPQEAVTDEQRNTAKTVIFGLLYGRGAKAISKVTSLNEVQAQAFIDGIFIRFPAVKAWIDARQFEAVRNNEIWTPFGRRRLLPASKYDEAEIERRGVNTVIQSAASDLTLMAGVVVWNQLNMLATETRMISFVHDALIFDAAAPREIWGVATIARKAMTCTPLQFPWSSGVRMEVDPEVGPSWGEKCKMKLLPAGKAEISGKMSVLPRMKWSLMEFITSVEIKPAVPEKKKEESFLMNVQFPATV